MSSTSKGYALAFESLESWLLWLLGSCCSAFVHNLTNHASTLFSTAMSHSLPILSFKSLQRLLKGGFELHFVSPCEVEGTCLISLEVIKDVWCFEVHLVRPQRVLELLRVWRRHNLSRGWLYDVDHEAWVLYGAQKGVKLEITNVLGTRWDNISWVKVVPHVGYFSDRDPMVALVCDKSLLSCISSRLSNWGGADRCCWDVTKLLQGFWQDLNRIVAIVRHVWGLLEEWSALSSK